MSLKPNIYNLLKTKFKIYDVLIDVGCSGLYDLVTFENSPFKKLIGIDKQFATNPFGDYRRCKTDSLNLTNEQYQNFSSELMKIFNKRYIINTMDFFQYNFEDETNSFIICNKVLHFYCDDKKDEIISRFYNSLQKDGLIYLKINHHKHPNNTDPTKMTRLKGNVYQNNEVEEDKRYLIEPCKFIKHLENNYHLLKSYTHQDDKTLTLVIRK